MRDKNRDRVDRWLVQDVNPIATGELSMGEAIRMIASFSGDSIEELREAGECITLAARHRSFPRFDQLGFPMSNRAYYYHHGQSHLLENRVEAMKEAARDSRSYGKRISFWIDEAADQQKRRGVTDRLAVEYPRWMVESSVPGRAINHSLGELSYTPYLIYWLGKEEEERGVEEWLQKSDVKSPGPKDYADSNTKYRESWAGHTKTCLPVRWMLESKGMVYITVHTEFCGVRVMTGEPLFMAAVKKLKGKS